MYVVHWKIYGKYGVEKSFKTYESAKKFFHVIRKDAKVTYAELQVPSA